MSAILRPLERRRVAFGIAATLALIGLVPQFLSRTLPDTSYLLYAAGRVLDGARLYVDLLEINPPLIVWLNMPVVAAARGLGISEITAYRVAVVVLLVASVVVCRWVLGGTEDGRDPALRRFLLILIVFALFLLPRLDWGEREHLTLALVLPYLLLTVVRLEGKAIRPLPAAALGVAAAVGIAIKPHFVLLCVAREAMILLAVPRRRPSVEGLAIVVAGAAYLGAVAIFAPEYAGLVRELGGAYQMFLRNTVLVTALLGDGAAIALGALLLALTLWRHAGSRPLMLTLAVAIGAFYIAAVLQRKGWRYHFYPALSLGWVLLAVLAVRLHRPLTRWTERLLVAIAGAGAASLALAAILGCLAQAVQPLDPRYDADPDIGVLIPLLREHSAGRDVLVLSPNMASGFPLTTYAGMRWPLRFQHLWPIVAAYDSAIWAEESLSLRPPAAMLPLERRIIDIVAEDLERSDAPLLLVLRVGPDEPRWGMRRIDLVGFFSRDERIRRFLSRYQRAGSAGQYEVFRRHDAHRIGSTIPG